MCKNHNIFYISVSYHCTYIGITFEISKPIWICQVPTFSQIYKTKTPSPTSKSGHMNIFSKAKITMKMKNK